MPSPSESALSAEAPQNCSAASARPSPSRSANGCSYSRRYGRPVRKWLTRSASVSSIGSAPMRIFQKSGIPSPAESMRRGSAPKRYSSRLITESPSGSRAASPGSSGSRPCCTSQPSGMPSPSLSGLCGSVFAENSREPVRPSPSRSVSASSGSSGSKPLSISQPSKMPSPSLSGLSGSVPEIPISSLSLRPSPSVSESSPLLPMTNSSELESPSPSGSPPLPCSQYSSGMITRGTVMLSVAVFLKTSVQIPSRSASGSRTKAESESGHSGGPDLAFAVMTSSTLKRRGRSSFRTGRSSQGGTPSAPPSQTGSPLRVTFIRRLSSPSTGPPPRVSR